MSLRENPNEPIAVFGDYDGKYSLRFATARLLKASCVECHNTHPDSPKRDFKLGDVMGGVVVTLPLE